MPNILQAISRNTGRFGSAVVPAAVTAGLTYASGGTLNPATMPGLLALLGTVKAGAGGLAAREEEERQRKLSKRYRKDQGIANFASALSQGRINPAVTPRDPGQSGVGQFAQMVGQGTSAAQTALQAQEAWKNQELQRKRLKLQIAEAEEAALIGKGRERAAEELLQRDQGEAGLRERIAEQGQQLTDRPPLQLQTEADAMRVLEESPESFSPRLSTLQSIGGAQATSAGKELEELWSGPKGSGLGFGSPSLQAAPAPTGPAAVGYYQAMAADEERRFKASLDVEAQDIRQRQLEYNKENLDNRTAHQKLQLEAEQAALEATRDFRAGESRDKHRIDTENYIQGLTSVKRLGEFRRNYQAVQNMLDTIAAGHAEAKRTGVEYVISGTTQIGLLNLFHNMIDPATVREGDIALYRKQAQGFFDSIQTDIKRITDNQSGVISPTLLEGMNGTLDILKGGYEQAAADQMGAFFKGRIRMGLEMIPAELTTGLRAASFTAYDLGDPDEMRKLLEQRILEAQQEYAPVQGPMFTPGSSISITDSGGNVPPANTVSDSGQNVQPSLRLDSFGRADSPWEGTPRGGLSTPQLTDFARMSEAEKKKRIAEYTSQGGRFMVDHFLSGKYGAPRMLADALGLL